MTWPSLVNDAYAHRLGWTLMHSLWQGALLTALLGAVLRVMRGSSANARYLAACVALAAAVSAGVVTFVAVKVDVPQPVILLGDTAPWQPAIEVAPAPPMTFRAAELPKPAVSTALLPSVVSLWICGVIALSLWHVAGWLWLQHWRAASPAAKFDLTSLCARVGVRRIVRLIECARVDVPAVIGALRPVILLPVGILNDLSATQIESILIHELAHIRRHDYLVNLLQTAAQTLLFYHPAVWWISSQIRRERENCCDDVVVAVTGDAITYAEALTALEGHRAPRRESFPSPRAAGG